MTTDTDRDRIGGNFPPLDPPETVGARLEREHAALFAEAAQVEAESFDLPEAPATDEEVAKLSDHVLKAKDVAKRLEEARTSFGRPYLEGTRIINAAFGEVSELLTDKDKGLIKRLTERVGIYARAKAAREQAERERKAAEERAAAEAARQEQLRQQREAERLAREAEEAAARIRQAKTDEEMRLAEAEMRQKDAAAGIARDAAGYAGKSAAQAERKADQNERAASADTGKLSRVSSAGSMSSATKVWTHTITDADALVKSLGPLAPHLSNDTVIEAVKRAVREAAAAGRADRLVLPGVRVFEDHRTNIRAVRT